MTLIVLLRAAVASAFLLPVAADFNAAQGTEQQTVVLQTPTWGCPTVYQAASWEPRERCVMVKPPASGRWQDGLSVQGNDYVKVAVDSGQTLWFSAVPADGPWQTWLVITKGKNLQLASAEAAAHAPPVPEFPEPDPSKFKLDERAVERWKSDGVDARMVPVPIKSVLPAWICPQSDGARDVEDALKRIRTTQGSDANSAARMLNDAVARRDCWLMDKGSEALDLGTTTDGSFRNVWVYRFPFGAPVIMLPHATGIGGWTAIEKQP